MKECEDCKYSKWVDYGLGCTNKEAKKRYKKYCKIIGKKHCDIYGEKMSCPFAYTYEAQKKFYKENPWWSVV